jgi:hypothetical protein
MVAKPALRPKKGITRSADWTTICKWDLKHMPASFYGHVGPVVCWLAANA